GRRPEGRERRAAGPRDDHRQCRGGRHYLRQLPPGWAGRARDEPAALQLGLGHLAGGERTAPDRNPRRRRAGRAGEPRHDARRGGQLTPPVRRPPPVVALLTDFGQEDIFAGVMKGVLLSRCPDVRLVDLTHAVPPGDVLAGALLLSAAAP